MADITSLLPAIDPVIDDIVYGVTDPGGTPADAVYTTQSLGSLQLLDTVSLTGASVDLSSIGSSSHIKVILEIFDAKFDTDNVSLLLRVNAGGIQSSNYQWGNFRWTSGGSTGVQASASDTSIQLADAIGDDTNESLSGRIELLAPTGATWKRTMGMLNYSTFNPSQFGLVHQGVWNGTTAVTALRLLPSSGNFASGVVKVFGLVG